MPKDYKDCRESNPKPAFYACLYGELRKIAVDNGYTLAIHGSLARDLDLIAVAWTEAAIEPDELIEKFLVAIGGTIYPNGWPVKNEKPFGRLAYTFSIMGDWFIFDQFELNRKN